VSVTDYGHVCEGIKLLELKKVPKDAAKAEMLDLPSFDHRRDFKTAVPRLYRLLEPADLAAWWCVSAARACTARACTRGSRTGRRARLRTRRPHQHLLSLSTVLTDVSFMAEDEAPVGNVYREYFLALAMAAEKAEADAELQQKTGSGKGRKREALERYFRPVQYRFLYRYLMLHYLYQLPAVDVERCVRLRAERLLTARHA
jgi:hypothetical protein